MSAYLGRRRSVLSFWVPMTIVRFAVLAKRAGAIAIETMIVWATWSAPVTLGRIMAGIPPSTCVSRKTLMSVRRIQGTRTIAKYVVLAAREKETAIQTVNVPWV
jgi:hypothetical protein